MFRFLNETTERKRELKALVKMADPLVNATVTQMCSACIFDSFLRRI